MVKEESSNRYHPYERTKKYVAGENPLGSAIKRKIDHPVRNDRLSVNELKRRIRDVKRVLNHADLPADAKAVQERALAAYEKDLLEEMDKRKRSDMIKKYHFVRFLGMFLVFYFCQMWKKRFSGTDVGNKGKGAERLMCITPFFLDRKRATKELKKLLRRERQTAKLDTATKAEDLATLSRQIREARTNVSYTINFPLTEKYVSLYPNKTRGTAENDELDCHDGTRRSTRLLRGHTHDGNDASAFDSTSLRQQTSTKRAAQSSFSRRSSSHVNSDESDNNDEKPSMWYTVEKCMANNTLDLLRDGKLSDAGTNTAETSVPAGIRTVTITSRVSSKTKTNNQTKKEVKQRKAAVRDHIHNSRYGEENDEDSEESGFFEE